MAKIGQTVEDKITGFKGVVTGLVDYISGCSQALVMPRVGEDGKATSGQWFDLQRLTILEAPIITLDNGETPGPDAPAPIR